MDTIGFIADPDQPVFRSVGQRLSARGFEVEFLRPTDPITPDDVDALAALVNCQLHPTSFAALRYADTRGIPTWNGFTVTAALSARLVAFETLESVGCRVPSVRFDPGAGYEAGQPYAWDGPNRLGEPAPFYVERVRTGPVDHRYYAVDDGRETHMRALSLRTSPGEGAPLVEDADVDVSLAARVRELLDQFAARAVAVDFAPGADGEFYAVRATPTPTFLGVGMDRRVADSVASLTTIGA
jgi:hypothetical protein